MKPALAILWIVLCSQGVAHAQGDLLIPYDIRLVSRHYHRKIAPVDEKGAAALYDALLKVPSKFPKDRELTVGNVWEHITKRLREEKVPIEVVFDTNMHPLLARRSFLEEPIKKVHITENDLPELKMRETVEKADCYGLVSIIIANTGFGVITRKNTIILSNYMSE